MAKNQTEQAAGGIVWRPADDGMEVLVAHRPRYDDWAYPKGKLDTGESLIECAAREVEEETGLRCEVGRFLGLNTFTMPSRDRKEVSYWAMQAVSGSFTPNDEVDAIEWVPYSKLAGRLSYELDLAFITSLTESWTEPAHRILLVRHAHAGDRFRWQGEDSLRPLSESGRREAARIVSQLRPFAIDRILSSPARRCRETVDPLASVRTMDFQSTDDLWEEAQYQDVVDRLDDSRHGATVLCTHGPIVAASLHALTGASVGLPMEKASTWVFDFAESTLATANYIAPPSV